MKYSCYYIYCSLLHVMLADFPSWTCKMHFRWHRGNLSTPVNWYTCTFRKISTDPEKAMEILTEPSEHSPKGKSHCSLLMVKLLKAALLHRRHRHNLKILCTYLIWPHVSTYNTYNTYQNAFVLLNFYCIFTQAFEYNLIY